VAGWQGDDGRPPRAWIVPSRAARAVRKTSPSWATALRGSPSSGCAYHPPGLRSRWRPQRRHRRHALLTSPPTVRRREGARPPAFASGSGSWCSSVMAAASPAARRARSRWITSCRRPTAARTRSTLSGRSGFVAIAAAPARSMASAPRTADASGRSGYWTSTNTSSMSPAKRTAPKRIPSQSGILGPVSLSEAVSALHAFPGIPEKLLMDASCRSNPNIATAAPRWGGVTETWRSVESSAPAREKGVAAARCPARG